MNIVGFKGAFITYNCDEVFKDFAAPAPRHISELSEFPLKTKGDYRFKEEDKPYLILTGSDSSKYWGVLKANLHRIPVDKPGLKNKNYEKELKLANAISQVAADRIPVIEDPVEIAKVIKSEEENETKVLEEGDFQIALEMLRYPARYQVFPPEL